MPDNALLDELKRRIADDSVVFIVGSGVSVQATGNAPCASWSGLLRHGIDYAEQIGRMKPAVAAVTRQQIDSGDLDLLLGAAQTVRAKLDNDFRVWLQESVGALTVKHPEVIDALQAVGATLATTNYDHLLGKPAIPWTEAANVEEVLRGLRKGVVHLHGDYEHPDSVILDIRSYERIVSSRHTTAILSAIRTLKTLVFIGCGDGLADPHFDEFFRWTEEAMAASPFRHFILCRAKDADELRRKHPPERKLYPMAYGASYEDLPAFLRALPPISGKRVDAARPEPTAAVTLPDPGPCFGRQTEVAVIVDALLADAPARVAVLGTGGIGKTTLTLTALRKPQVAARFGSRRFFVRCDPATNRDGLLRVIAAHLGITSGGQLDNVVLAAMASSAAVLVLDNFETPWQSETIEVENFLALLSGIESLQLIITMRGIERPAGILWCDPVEPPRLPLPAAREAFLAIATRFAGDPHLDELLEVMDRLPLAITLLAHVAQRETHLEALLKQWNDKRTSMLQRAGGGEKATNIEVSFELSIASPRMTTNGRRLLSILAILPAGIAEADISAILDDGDTAASALRACGLAFDEAGRIRMLAPLRAYVANAYEIGDADEERLLAFYFAMTVRGYELGRTSGAEAAKWLTPELGNASAILERARTLLDRAINRTDRHITIDKNKTLAIAAIKAAEKSLGKHALCIGLVRKVVGQIVADDPSLDSERAHEIRKMGRRAYDRHENEIARKNFLKAQDLFRKVGYAWGNAHSVRELGELALSIGDLPVAESYFREAVPLFRKLRDSFNEADCTLRLGEIARQRSEFDTSRANFKEALRLSQRSNNLRCEALSLRGLGDVSFAESTYVNARQQYEGALTISVRIGNVLGQAHAICSMAECLERTGDLSGATENAQRALSLYEQCGSRLNIGRANVWLASLALTEAARQAHLVSAREAFISVGRDDLANELS